MAQLGQKSVGLAFAALLGAAATAQMTPDSDFMRAMTAGMQRMDREMMQAPLNGNPDHDFAVMMIPHHQGAIDMAKVELRYGKDPVLRRMAQEILVDQQSEIDAMQLWLKKKASKEKEKP